MLIASKRLAGGAGLAGALLRRTATVELDWDTRQKSRFDAVDTQGRALGVVLPRGTVLRGGDVLVCDDGSLVAVRARPQTVLAVSARAGRSPNDLLRAAYHLGNRHVPLEVGAEKLQLEPDHVLAEMLERMGLVVETVEAAFEPEAGAYEAGRAQGGGRAHDHAHDRDRAHDHAHDPHPESQGHGHAAHPRHD